MLHILSRPLLLAPTGASVRASKTTHNLRPLGLVLSGLLFLAGCGAKWPPAVQNAQDLERLAPNGQWIRARGLRDRDLAGLGRFKDLRDLDFVGGWKGTPSRITAKGLETIAALQLARLEALSLGYSDQIDDACLDAVGRIRTLRTVELFACNRITGNGIRMLDRLEHLDSLYVLGCQGLGDDDLRQFAALRNIREGTTFERLPRHYPRGCAPAPGRSAPVSCGEAR